MACHTVINTFSFIAIETIKINGSVLKENCNTVRTGK